MALRVLAVAQAAELGGAELALLRLAPALRADGLELELAVPGDGGVARAARDAGLVVHELPLGRLRAGGWPRALVSWPRTLRLARRFDVVWLNGVVPLRLVPALGGVPAVLHLHDLLERAPRPWRSERFWRAVPLVACASEAVAHAAAAAGAPQSRLRTVPVPVDPAEPAPRPAWADGRPVVGFVGRLEPRKGVLDLLEAMPRVADQVDGARLVIVRGPALEPRTVRRRAQGAGADPDGSDYERRVAEAAAGLGDAVVVTGPVPDARSLMPWFDVLCVPSLAEPFGTVAAEALAAGTPAVVTDSGGMPEYVVPGRNGDVVPPGDPERLAEALARILPRAGELREPARESVARFRTPRAAREMAALLREAAGR